MCLLKGVLSLYWRKLVKRKTPIKSIKSSQQVLQIYWNSFAQMLEKRSLFALFRRYTSGFRSFYWVWMMKLEAADLPEMRHYASSYFRLLLILYSFLALATLSSCVSLWRTQDIREHMGPRAALQTQAGWQRLPLTLFLSRSVRVCVSVCLYLCVCVRKRRLLSLQICENTEKTCHRVYLIHIHRWFKRPI